MTLLQALYDLKTLGIVSKKVMSTVRFVAKIYEGAAAELPDMRYSTWAEVVKLKSENRKLKSRTRVRIG